MTDEKMLELFTSFQTSINKRFDELSFNVSDLKTDIRNIHLHLENVTDKNIITIAENVSSANERLVTIENDVTELKDNQAIADVLTELGSALKR